MNPENSVMKYFHKKANKFSVIYLIIWKYTNIMEMMDASSNSMEEYIHG